MKKIVLFLACCLVCFFAGCSNPSISDTPDKDIETFTSESTQESEDGLLPQDNETDREEFNDESLSNTSSSNVDPLYENDFLTVEGTLLERDYEINSENKGTAYILELDEPIIKALYSEFMGYDGEISELNEIQVDFIIYYDDAYIKSHLIGNQIEVMGQVMYAHTGHHQTTIVLKDCVAKDSSTILIQDPLEVLSGAYRCNTNSANEYLQLICNNSGSDLKVLLIERITDSDNYIFEEYYQTEATTLVCTEDGKNIFSATDAEGNIYNGEISFYKAHSFEYAVMSLNVDVKGNWRGTKKEMINVPLVKE